MRGEDDAFDRTAVATTAALFLSSVYLHISALRAQQNVIPSAARNLFFQFFCDATAGPSLRSG